MTTTKSQFISDWLDDNWPKFVTEGVEDSHGRLITVADTLELTACEHKAINEAFKVGACKTHEAIEVIAKAFLIDVVVECKWKNHLAAKEELEEDQKDAAAELAFENHDLKESAR